MPVSMTPLHHHLARLIQQEGPLSFARFMQLALYDPEHGFYAPGRLRVGKQGDFFTNVSVGPLFGRMLALQLTELWQLQNRPPLWNLIEQGADRGLLSLDILSALQTHAPDCYEAARLWIVEPFRSLQNTQAETLQSHAPKVRWFDSLTSLPPGAHGLFCNELLDAFPCHRLQRVQHAWMEILVHYEAGAFTWTPPMPPSADLLPILPLLPNLPEGFHAEASPAHADWLRVCREKIPGGWLLILDYGMTESELFLPHRREGTLSAYAQHQRRTNPLASPGDQDLTFHLNFTLLANLARSAGWTIAGYLDQSRFFTAWAPHYFRDDSPTHSPAQLKERLAFRSLIDPNLLGSRFKVLALQNQAPPLQPWTGFRFAQDASWQLEESGLP